MEGMAEGGAELAHGERVGRGKVEGAVEMGVLEEVEHGGDGVAAVHPWERLKTCAEVSAEIEGEGRDEAGKDAAVTGQYGRDAHDGNAGAERCEGFTLDGVFPLDTEMGEKIVTRGMVFMTEGRGGELSPVAVVAHGGTL